MASVRRTRITASVDAERGVFMISVAAELAEMHPQTLRMYEQRGLIEPQRSPKGTRLYSHADVERLRRIQELTSDGGMNLAGVEKVFELEGQLERMQRKVGALERRAAELEAEIERLEAVKREVKAEIVRYEAVSTDLVPVRVRRRRATESRCDRDAPPRAEAVAARRRPGAPAAALSTPPTVAGSSASAAFTTARQDDREADPRDG